MKKFIPIILVTFLCIGNLSYAGISDKERVEFNSHLKRIEDSQRLYRERKETFRKSEQKRAEQKRTKAKRKRELNNIAKRNSRLARKRLIRDDVRRKNNLKRGQCILSEATGNKICK